MTVRSSQHRWWPRLLTFGLLSLASLPAAQRLQAQGDERYAQSLVEKGDYYFRRGYYVRASEQYHLAVLERPQDGLVKLRHGQAQFAEGNFSYAAYNLRRGIRFAEYPDDLEIDLIAFFPTPNAFRRALAELERQVEFYPDDPVHLSVLGYVYFFGDRTSDAERIFQKLAGVKARDNYAGYFLRRIARMRPGDATVPPPIAEEAKPKPAVARPDEPDPDPEPIRPSIDEDIGSPPAESFGEGPLEGVLHD